MALPVGRRVIRSGAYEFDASSGDVRKRGRLVKLQSQPREVLRLLVSRAGEVVTREELRQTLWGDATHVDFDNGLNVAIRKIRDVLGDSPAAPRFIQTVPREGYRFIAECEDDRLPAGSEPAASVTSPDVSVIATGSADQAPSLSRRTWARWSAMALVALPLVLVAALAVITQRFGAPPSPPLPVRLESVAVLPFVNLLGDADREYLVDGLTDTLITELAAAGLQRVIARQSAMQFRDTTKSAAEVGRELGVDALVQGSVTRAGAHYVVNVQLIEAATGRHRWAGRFDRSGLAEITAVGDIAESLLPEMGLGSRPATRLARSADVRPQARDAYLRGIFFWHRRSGADLKRALDYFRAAIRIQPDYAAAWAGLAGVYAVGSPNSATLGIPEATVIREGRHAAEEAIRLDPTIGEPHAALGRILMAEWHWGEAERQLLLAVQLSPQFATGYQWYGTLLMRLGRCDEALPLVEAGARLDPLAPLVNDAVAAVYASCGQPHRAVELRRGLLELHPANAAVRHGLAVAYTRTGDYELAIGEAREAIRLDPDNCYYKTVGLAAALSKASRPAEARSILDELTRSVPPDSARLVCLAAANAAVGDANGMFAHLEHAFREHSAYMDLLMSAPWITAHRRDPRYVRLLERLGLISDEQSREAAIAGPAFRRSLDTAKTQPR